MIQVNSWGERREFDRNRKRVQECPCGRSNKDGKFVPFKGQSAYGYCHSCTVTFTPDLYPPKSPGLGFPVSIHLRNEKRKHGVGNKSDTYIRKDLVIKSCCEGFRNFFVEGLKCRFPNKSVVAVIKEYLVGSSKHWPGATVFWRIDRYGNVRSGKIMLYDKDTLKRVKEPFTHITWVHKVLGLPKVETPCFFGEHLLRVFPKYPVAIVESEKTAIIGRIVDPKYVWLATGGIGGLSPSICETLYGRKGVIVPDLGAYDEWNNKVKGMHHLYGFTVSAVLEQMSTEIALKEKWDLADFILNKHHNSSR